MLETLMNNIALQSLLLLVTYQSRKLQEKNNFKKKGLEETRYKIYRNKETHFRLRCLFLEP